MILVVVGADHVHAAGVDQGRDAALHAGAEDVLGSCGRRKGGASPDANFASWFYSFCKSSFKRQARIFPPEHSEEETSKIPVTFLNWWNLDSAALTQ